MALAPRMGRCDLGDIREGPGGRRRLEPAAYWAAAACAPSPCLTSVDATRIRQRTGAAIWVVGAATGGQGPHTRPPATGAAAAHTATGALAHALWQRVVFAIPTGQTQVSRVPGQGESGPHPPRACRTWWPGWGCRGQRPGAARSCASPPRSAHHRSPWQCAAGTVDLTQSPVPAAPPVPHAAGTPPSCPSPGARCTRNSHTQTPRLPAGTKAQARSLDRSRLLQASASWGGVAAGGPTPPRTPICPKPQVKVLCLQGVSPPAYETDYHRNQSKRKKGAKSWSLLPS